MKSIITFISLLPFCLFAQSNISGIINDYAAVLSYQEVECGSVLTVDDTSGFEDVSEAIIIQMQGATINSDNNSSFGTITQIGEAGHYELVHITGVTGNEIMLSSTLLYPYDFSASVQLVSMPAYEIATVSGTVTGMPWNGSKGGVIALQASNLSLNAGISADGIGFRGGVADITAINTCTFLTNANDYWYELNDWFGAQKGEGIAPVISGKESGRGPQANAGGGGNAHNSGGGGGANVRTGGQGGENREPSLFGCDGDFPGLGGKAISSTANRIFMGGGGGAGHEDNDGGTDGGRGGGIIFIIADELHGNNEIISANGADALATSGTDGAGGGGGAGSILLLCNTIDNLDLQAMGGNGGDGDNHGADRCMGPGGGGSGGRILTNFNLASSDYVLDAGAPGKSINSTACPVTSNGATAGQNGILESIFSIPENTNDYTAPVFTASQSTWQICEGIETTINPQYEGTNLTYQWEINTGLGFVALADNEQYQGTMTAELTISEPTLDMEAYTYRLVLMSYCFEPVFSDGFQLSVAPLPFPFFEVTIDGLVVGTTNLSEEGDAYLWDFGDGTNSNDSNPSHTYSEGGVYTISLSVTNDCGVSTYMQTIELGVAPTADFSTSQAGGCAPLEVTFHNESTGVYSNILWSFPGGTPTTSTDENPVVQYETPGIYAVTLNVDGSLGMSEIHNEMAVVVKSSPSASFTYDILSPTIVSFQNTSQNADYYNWNFGDNNHSTEENPTHEYATPGAYEVTLNAQNPYCGNAFSAVIMLMTATSEAEKMSVDIFPNPVKNTLYISSPSTPLRVRIFNNQAKVLEEQEINRTGQIDMSKAPSGVYFLVVNNGKAATVYRIIKAE